MDLFIGKKLNLKKEYSDWPDDPPPSSEVTNISATGDETYLVVDYGNFSGWMTPAEINEQYEEC